MSEVVLVETEGSVRRLTMNRPNKLNAMNGELVDNLVAQLQAAEEDDAIAVIVLAGAGRAFSAGADISKSEGPPPTPHQLQVNAERSTGLYKQMLSGNKPLIAQVHGYVLGGGCNLAVSSDLVVAADSAVFGYPELKRGLAATSVSPPLVHRMGQKAAFEMLTLCENISAEQALQLGLINRVVPSDALAEQTMQMANTLAGFDHDALWMTKQTIRRAGELPLLEALDMSRDLSLRMKLFESD